MAEITTQGQDRVAAVVARVLNTPEPILTVRDAAWRTVRALDAAGLLLTAARRERIVEFIQHAGPEYIDPVSAERHERHRDALLRELAGDGGAPASEPVCSGCGAWAKDCFCTPTPAPRRMAGNPVSGAAWHMREHDEDANCADHPPCQPVAAVDPTPAHEHRWTAVAWESSGGAYSRAKRVTREHCTRGDCTATREVGHGG